MRNNLYMFRAERRMSQEAIAEKIGCKRATYSAIENGTRNGRPDFWLNLQSAFNVPDADMWRLMLND